MCGIAGYCNKNPLKAAQEDILEAMGESLAHRGPDGKGVLLCNNLGLARRLRQQCGLPVEVDRSLFF